MTEAMPFLQNYDITFLRPPPFRAAVFLKAAVHCQSSGMLYLLARTLLASAISWKMP